MKIYRYHPGFTLVELLLYVAGSAVLLMIVSVFLSELLRARVKNQTVAEVEQQGVQAMNTITKVVRNAATINTPSMGATDDTTLSVTSPSTVTSVFQLISGAITESDNGGAEVALTNSQVTVSNFVIQNLSRSGTPGTVRIRFTLTYKNTRNQYEYDYKKTFYTSATLLTP